MATLAAGDVTTQLSKWIAANATGGDVNTKIRAAAASATGLSGTKDVTMLLQKFIAR